VICHDTGRLVWAAPGRDKDTLRGFFDELGEDRCKLITHVSADQADWIAAVVAERCPTAVRAADPFHIVAWATEALDQARRKVWNQVRSPTGGRRHTNATGEGKKIKDARFALWKNPEDLTSRQQAKLDWIAKAHPRLHRAYLLKEKLRLIFRLPIAEAAPELDAWIAWARRCRIPEFIDLQRRISKHKQAILTAIAEGLSNGRTEAVNTRIRLLTRIAYGFHNPHTLIGLAMLTLGGHRPTLPGRAA
jgi:transposase